MDGFLRCGIRERGDVFDEVEADLRVALHDFAIFGSKRAGFQKDAIWHTEFSDVFVQ